MRHLARVIDPSRRRQRPRSRSGTTWREARPGRWPASHPPVAGSEASPRPSKRRPPRRTRPMGSDRATMGAPGCRRVDGERPHQVPPPERGGERMIGIMVHCSFLSLPAAATAASGEQPPDRADNDRDDQQHDPSHHDQHARVEQDMPLTADDRIEPVQQPGQILGRRDPRSGELKAARVDRGAGVRSFS